MYESALQALRERRSAAIAEVLKLPQGEELRGGADGPNALVMELVFIDADGRPRPTTRRTLSAINGARTIVAAEPPAVLHKAYVKDDLTY